MQQNKAGLHIWKFVITNLLLLSICEAKQKPHVIVIVADDLGWNDVGFHGSKQIPTPNIDALAYSGVILNNYYVQPICTPSRSALMTGMHPIHTGLQSYTIAGPQPYGLPLSLKTLPEYLKESGYVNRHVGKWHLGFYHKEFTPTFRGFESHIGYWTGRIDYYDHTSLENTNMWGLDFRRDMQADSSTFGQYATDIFTKEAVQVINNHNSSSPLFLYLAHLAVHSGNDYDPLQAPLDIIQKFDYIKDENRRKFAAMLWKLDDSVGQVVESLRLNGMLSNSIIVFTTDNGGPAGGFNNNAASNWPFRGTKATLWEGGVRGASAVWSPLIKQPGRVSHSMMQITDWLPTLINAVGGDMDALPAMDGKNMWPSIANGEPSKRSQILHNIDPQTGGAAVRVGDWKLLYTPSPYDGKWDGWIGPSGRNETNESSRKQLRNILKSAAGKAVSSLNHQLFTHIKQSMSDAEVVCGPVPEDATRHCQDVTSPCLFNIARDPCEYHDVSDMNPYKVRLLMDLIQRYNETAVEPLNQKFDPAANPLYWNYTWTNWKDYPPPPSNSLV